MVADDVFKDFKTIFTSQILIPPNSLTIYMQPWAL